MQRPDLCTRCGQPRNWTLPCASCLLTMASSRLEPLNLEGEAFGNYVLGRLLGQGGMGIVYEAVDVRLRRTVALKILADDVHSSEVLLHEAELAAELEHEHIVPIYEADEVDGIAYFTMKRIDGGVLETPAPTECRAAESVFNSRTSVLARFDREADKPKRVQR